MSIRAFFDLALEHWDISLFLIFIFWPLIPRFFDLLSGRPRRNAEKRELAERAKELDQKAEDIRQQQENLNHEVRLKTVELVKNIAARSYLQDAPAYQTIRFGDNGDAARMLPALTSSMYISAPFDLFATIRSDSGESYSTTLYSCSCPDFTFRKKPCKHMLRLALEVGLLFNFEAVPVEKDLEKLLTSECAAQKELESLRSKRSALERILAEKQQTFPWLAKLYADYLMVSTDRDIQYLRNKPRPAGTTADRIEKEIRQELSQWRLRAKQTEYQLHIYESLFPWLVDFKENTPVEASTYAANASTGGTEYDQSKNWLSPEEYSKLSEAERNQLSLDRYIARSKSNWDVGIEYERYIGYLCEASGFSVQYYGATKFLNDMGRDLILEKGNQVILVQCKRWAAEKTIHENHVFQLAGSVFEYQRCQPQKDVLGVFVTTTDFSPTAKYCAEQIGIRLYPKISFQEYPRIKCNINKDGQKIYHLPFDQQYDNIKLTHPGECYVSTVQEAIESGFRHACRWSGTEKADFAPAEFKKTPAASAAE